MKKIIIYLLSLCFLLLTGCATKEKMILSYDNSNPVKIELSAQQLEVTDLLPSPKKVDGTIAIRSIEDNIDDRIDGSVRYMIEDNLISNLIENGYRVVERDPDVLDNLYRESSSKYQFPNDSEKNEDDDSSDSKSNATAIAVDDEGTVININIGDSSRGDDSDNNSKESSDKNDEEEYKTTVLSASDYILSYRVLECGVSYRSAEKEDESRFKMSDVVDDKIERTARTKLHLRLTNSKTSEILAAGLLEGKVRDIIKKSDADNLTQIPHDFYFHTLPLMNTGIHGESDGYSAVDEGQIIEKAGEKGKISNKIWMYILGGIALISI